MWKEGRRHTFFAVIGMDQYIHEFCLLLTAALAWWVVSPVH
jgi:hypothetical protein